MRDLITSRAEVFTPQQVDELYQIFQSQGAAPSAYALPDYTAAMDLRLGAFQGFLTQQGGKRPGLTASNGCEYSF